MAVEKTGAAGYADGLLHHDSNCISEIMQILQRHHMSSVLSSNQENWLPWECLTAWSLGACTCNNIHG